MPDIKPASFPPERFFILRHGETTGNAQNLVSGGNSDVSLTRTGEQQAEAAMLVLEALADAGKINLDAVPIYRSELQRTEQTLAPFLTAHSHLSATILSGLNERSWGDIDGKISRKEAEEIVTKLGVAEAEKQHGIEPRPAFFQRVQETIATILEGPSPIICAHQGVLNAIMSATYRIPVKETDFKAKNATVYEFSPRSEDIEGQKPVWTVYEHRLEQGVLKSRVVSPNELRHQENPAQARAH